MINKCLFVFIIVLFVISILIIPSYDIESLVNTISYNYLKNQSNIGNQIIFHLSNSIKQTLYKTQLLNIKLEKFPKYITFNEKERHDLKKLQIKKILQLRYKVFIPCAWDQSYRHEYTKYWSIIRSKLNSLYSDILPTKRKTNVPVIHFRCSDIPMVRHSFYHIPKKESILWVCELMKNRGYKKAILLSCNSHLSNNKKKQQCTMFKDFYIDIFKNQGIMIETQCNALYEDMSLMFHSPLLISLNVSSFSFIIGISKDPSTYCSALMGRERDRKYESNPELQDWIVNPTIPLLHCEVKDYYDKNILTLL